MGISIVASFLDPTEAEIAAGALRSAGFQAVAMDQYFASVDSIARQALGGMRVGVPDDELAEAVQFLRSILDARPKRRARIQRGLGWRLTAVVFGFLSPPIGWLVVGIAKARGRGRLAAMLLVFAIVALITAGMLALFVWAPHALYPDGRPYTS